MEASMNQEPTEQERFIILMEDMRGEFRKVTEHVLSIDQKMDRGFTEIREDLNNFKIEMRLAYKGLSKDVNVLRADMDYVKADTKDIRVQMEPMQAILIDHDNRIINVESAV